MTTGFDILRKLDDLDVESKLLKPSIEVSTGSWWERYYFIYGWLLILPATLLVMGIATFINNALWSTIHQHYLSNLNAAIIVPYSGIITVSAVAPRGKFISAIVFCSLYSLIWVSLIILSLFYVFQNEHIFQCLKMLLMSTVAIASSIFGVMSVKEGENSYEFKN